MEEKWTKPSNFFPNQLLTWDCVFHKKAKGSIYVNISCSSPAPFLAAQLRVTSLLACEAIFPLEG